MINLSIILVVKNEISYLAEMLRSIENTCPNFINYDIVIIDDHSSDGTLEWSKSYSTTKTNTQVVLNNGEGKVSGTIQGLKMARSKWIKFADGDDTVDFSDLSELSFQCDAFYHNYYKFDELSRKLMKTSRSLTNNQMRWIYNLRTIPKAMFFFKKELFASIDLNKFQDLLFEDIFINYVICHNSVVIKKCNGAYYNYRQHSNNFYGGSFRRNRQKVCLMGYRLETSFNIFQNLYPRRNINPYIPLYAQFLRQPTLSNLIKITRSPYLLFKGIYYYVISRI